MEQEIIHADKNYRRRLIRRTIITYLLCFLIGSILILWGLRRTQEYLGKLDCKTAYLVIKVAIIFIFLSILPLAIYFLRFGQRIIESKQLPLPGAKVIRDTKVIRGERAMVRGRMVIVLSLLMICLSLIGAFYIPYKMDKIIKKKVGITKSNYSDEIPM